MVKANVDVTFHSDVNELSSFFIYVRQKECILDSIAIDLANNLASKKMFPYDANVAG